MILLELYCISLYNNKNNKKNKANYVRMFMFIWKFIWCVSNNVRQGELLYPYLYNYFGDEFSHVLTKYIDDLNIN